MLSEPGRQWYLVLWVPFGFAFIKTFDFPRPFCVLSYLHNAVASVFAHTLSILPLDPILLSGTSPTFIL